MCHQSCVDFGIRVLPAEQVTGKRVLEVGARDVNGSLRSHVEALGSVEYVGVDIEAGPGVDQVCSAEDLVNTFGPDRFDVVISTEVIEHIRDWRTALQNMVGVCSPGGSLLLTTRSRGFGYHAWPHDYWRFELEDMREAFSGMEITALESDPLGPGVFVQVVKPERWAGFAAPDLALFNVLLGRRARDFPEGELRLKLYVARAKVKRRLRKIMGRKAANVLGIEA